MPETSIVIKAEDRYSSVLKNLSSVTSNFDKNAEHLERTLHELSGEKTLLKAETDKARKAMQEAQKQFAKTNDAADGLAASLAGQEYEDYRRKLEAINSTMKDTEKQIRSVEGVARKSGGNVSTGIGSLVNALAAGGIGNMVGQLAQEGANIVVSSAFDSAAGSVFSSGLSSAISGASIGTMIAPGIGTAIGAGIGALSGAVAGNLQNFEKKDDAFKDYYKSLYETVSQATEEGLTNGKTLAAQRETDRLSFATLLGGEKQADAFLSKVLRTADSTPFLYDDLTGISKTLLSFGYAVEDIIPTLTKVGDAGAAMGLSTSDIGAVATYIGRMKSSDKASLEYLNPLNERGFGVFQWLADDLGISQKKVYDKISKGELSGTYVSDLILSKFADLYGGQMAVQAASTEGLDSTLQGLKENIEAAGGEAYNALRNKGKEADIAAYDGALGKVMEKVNAISGENRAYGENLQEEYTRQALSAVLLGEKASVFSAEDQKTLEDMRAEFREASARYEMTGDREAGQKMEQLREEAEALATAAYESSDWYQNNVLDTELDQIDAIRDNTRGLEAATNAYKKANAFTKGMGFWTLNNGISADTTDPNALPGMAPGQSMGRPSRGAYYGSNAFGLKRVPFDGYRAILHQDERVLTAAEAREREGGGVRVTFSGPITVRQDSDLDEIASRLADKIELARVRSG